MRQHTKKGIWSKVVWCGKRTRFDVDWFDLLQPRREVHRGGRFRSGVFHSAKCGRDIQYESALELGFVELCERDERVVFYWDQPVRIPTAAAGGASATRPTTGSASPRAASCSWR